MDLGSASRPDGTASTAASIDAPLGMTPSRASGAATDDAELMLRYRDGDVRSFEMLYERHKRPLYRYLQRMCASRETADDVFQEVWSKVIASRARYEVRAQFKTFLFRIAHNCVVDHYRRSGRKTESVLEPPEEIEEQVIAAVHERPDEALSEAQVRADFRRALDALPAEQRDVFVLYEETGLGLDEIGRITGVAMETAKSRLRYALGKLRAALSQHRPGSYQSSVQP